MFTQHSSAHESPSNKINGARVDQEAHSSFSFMKKVARACWQLSVDEVSSHGNRAGMVYFWSSEDGKNAKMISRDEVDKKKHIGVRVENVLARAGMCGKDWKGIGPHTTVEHITLRWPSSFDPEEYSLRSMEATSKMGTIGQFLMERKKEFSELDSVQEISQLEKLDVIFIRFEQDGQMYSITVSESSRKVQWKMVALCDVVYRVKDAYGKFKEVQSNGIMTLPLKVGGEMHFIVNGKLVRELAAHKIKKLQHKSIKSGGKR